LINSALTGSLSARSISAREISPLPERSLTTRAMREARMPKRSIAASEACATLTPIKVGSVTTTILLAREMNGRTVAANGCGASTMTSASGGSAPIARVTDADVSTRPSS
jgi:hypothetical protein